MPYHRISTHCTMSSIVTTMISNGGAGLGSDCDRVTELAISGKLKRHRREKCDGLKSHSILPGLGLVTSPERPRALSHIGRAKGVHGQLQLRHDTQLMFVR